MSRSSLLLEEVIFDGMLWMGKRDSRTLKGKVRDDLIDEIITLLENKFP